MQATNQKLCVVLETNHAPSHLKKIVPQVSSHSYAANVSRFHKGLMISRVERETKRKRANWPGMLLTRKMQKKKNCFSSLY
jgi:hypothetical protein